MRRSTTAVSVLVLGVGCLPLRDLDSASAGSVRRTQGGAGSCGAQAQTGRGGDRATASDGGKCADSSASVEVGGAQSRSSSDGGAAQNSDSFSQSSGGLASMPGDTGGTELAAGGAQSHTGGNSLSGDGATSPLSAVGGRALGLGGRTFTFSRARAAGRGTATTAGTVGAVSGGAGGVAEAPTSAGVASNTASSAGQAGAGWTGASAVAPDLPDMPSSPVTGMISYSSDASWNMDGTDWPAFEIHTPTANYWLVKSAAAMVSITDPAGSQWIGYKYSAHPHRGVPNLGGCCEPGDPSKLGLAVMNTEIDPQCVPTSTHLRLVSKPVSGVAYWLVWDFYLTHVTVTVNRAEASFGFTYRGTPAGNLDDDDKLVLPTGVTQTAKTPFTGDVSSGDLRGSFEWVYLVDPQQRSSLFLIQHADDSLPESYQIADGDSAMFTFGGGRLSSTPIRFSLGLINRTDHSAVSDRVSFVAKFVGD